jgi:hypothetical protein
MHALFFFFLGMLHIILSTIIFCKSNGSTIKFVDSYRSRNDKNYFLSECVNLLLNFCRIHMNLQI